MRDDDELQRMMNPPETEEINRLVSGYVWRGVYFGLVPVAVMAIAILARRVLCPLIGALDFCWRHMDFVTIGSGLCGLAVGGWLYYRRGRET